MINRPSELDSFVFSTITSELQWCSHVTCILSGNNLNLVKSNRPLRGLDSILYTCARMLMISHRSSSHRLPPHASLIDRCKSLPFSPPTEPYDLSEHRKDRYEEKSESDSSRCQFSSCASVFSSHCICQSPSVSHGSHFHH
jgi:hypothetical protein